MQPFVGDEVRPFLTRIMHHAARFCTLGELARPDVPSGGIGVRQLVMQRVRGRLPAVHPADERGMAGEMIAN